jgi:hypothetical protein
MLTAATAAIAGGPPTWLLDRCVIAGLVLAPAAPARAPT